MFYRELLIALSTVRTYTKSLYSKLDVNHRRAAVKRAKALGLIYRSPENESGRG
jgi:LuxR family transcriptional regulator, maltose regulon positive regulatory protein